MAERQREYKTLSARVSPELNTSFIQYCERKGVTASWELKSLVESTVEKIVPVNKAGKNSIIYNKDTDSFTWEIHFDDGSKAVVAQAISPLFLENAVHALQESFRLRDLYLNKTKRDSVPAPTKIREVVES